ncbi:DUF2339 domain-containing protein [Halosegnis longus]|uniref:hypothetical protein n=1 Tax=Halosegnis longus TaxID=2216012 RepID=UPI001181650C|nr:hypothetical protein [Salella cibi]
MSNRRLRWSLLVATGVLILAMVTRSGLLYWSSLPGTLDGFRYAALAERLLATGTLPVDVLDADEFIFTLGLGLASLVTGRPPVRLAQPFVTVAGAVGPLLGAALAIQLVRRLDGWTHRSGLAVATLAGSLLAINGLYVQRTGVPDEGALAHVLIALLVLVAAAWLETHDWRWGMLTGLVLGTFPLLHNLGTLIAVLTLTALGALYLIHAQTWTDLLRVSGLVVASWTVFIGYYELAAWVGLNLTYTGLIRPYVGLVVAWVIVLIIGVLWLYTTSSRWLRTTGGILIGGLFVLVVVNAIRPVFPGTIPTPLFVLIAVFGLVPVAALAVVGLSPLRSRPGLGILAAGAAPMILIAYLLTASLTPPFFDALIRVQAYLQLPASIAAAVAVGWIWYRYHTTAHRRLIVTGVVCVLVVGTLMTFPLALFDLDTGAPSTAMEAEFQATGFTTTYSEGSFAAGQYVAKISRSYYGPLETAPQFGETGRATVQPIRQWLDGAPPPACPTLVQQRWTTSGAHLYPTPPKTLDADRLDHFRTRNSVVYTAGTGPDATWFVIPSTNSSTTRC